MSKTVAVIFGGNSSESEISVISGVEALRAMPSKGYKTIPIYIHKNKWLTGAMLYDINTYRKFNPKLFQEVRLLGKTLYYKNRLGKLKKYADVDVALLCTHGGDGEDGTLQGFLEVNGLPFTSSDTAGCALTMDKVFTKCAAKGLGVPVVQGRAVTYPADEETLELLEDLYNYPMIVKPAKGGSSIGITYATKRSELINGLELGFSMGKRVLVERGLRDFAEVNCAAMRLNGSIILSRLEKPITADKFLTFADKYEVGAGGMSNAKREFPAVLPEFIADTILKYTERLYEGLDLRGVVRMDFLIEGEDVYLNEINAIPGSLAHYLFTSFNYTNFLKALIEEALASGIPQKKVFETHIFDSGKIFRSKK